MRSLIQKVLSESIIIYIKNSNHNTNLKEIKKGYCEKCRTNKKKGHNKMTKQEQQNGIVHASYSELQLEELETISGGPWLPDVTVKEDTVKITWKWYDKN